MSNEIQNHLSITKEEALSRAWILTYTNKKFKILDPQPEDIDIVDIAHSLANQSRFTGHTIRRVSIAEHCLLVREIVNRIWVDYLGLVNTLQRYQDELWGLMHDAAEAYLVDLAKPVKMIMPEYCRIEDKIMGAICGKFEINPSMPKIVKDADKIALVIEAKLFMGKGMKDCQYLQEYLRDIRENNVFSAIYKDYTRDYPFFEKDHYQASHFEEKFLLAFNFLSGRIKLTGKQLNSPNT